MKVNSLADTAYEDYKKLKQEISEIEKRKRESLSRKWETFEDVERHKGICDELESKKRERYTSKIDSEICVRTGGSR